MYGGAKIRDLSTLLAGIHADGVGASGGGADIGPSVQQAGIPAMSLDVDGNYFLIHHTPADTIDKIDPLDIARSSAAIAVMTYVIAEPCIRVKDNSCVEACPVDAIFAESQLPAKWLGCAQINADQYKR